jgi:hypothetical protein
MKNANMFALNVISGDKDILYFGANSPEELNKWIEVVSLAFKDITEEHRAAVRSIAGTVDASTPNRSSLAPTFGRGLGLGNKTRMGLSSVVMIKAASRKTHLLLTKQKLESVEAVTLRLI